VPYLSQVYRVCGLIDRLGAVARFSGHPEALACVRRVERFNAQQPDPTPLPLMAQAKAKL
jgi:hypothetical protein